jgi:hypothetical protein
MPKPPASRRDSVGNIVTLGDIVCFPNPWRKTVLAAGVVRGFTREGVKVQPFSNTPDLRAYFELHPLNKQPSTFMLMPGSEEHRGIAYNHLCRLLPGVEPKEATQ